MGAVKHISQQTHFLVSARSRFLQSDWKLSFSPPFPCSFGQREFTLFLFRTVLIPLFLGVYAIALSRLHFGYSQSARKHKKSGDCPPVLHKLVMK